MSDSETQAEVRLGAAQSRTATWIGLFGALFGMLVIRSIVQRSFADPRQPSVVLLRELLHFAAAGGLLLLIKLWEKRPLSSIGIGTSSAGKSAGWGLVTGVLCFGIALALASLTHYGHDAAGKSMDRLPIWLVTMVVFRAGIVEEIFYRGYAMERLREVGLSRAGAFIVPLVIFGLGHYTGGLGQHPDCPGAGGHPRGILFLAAGPQRQHVCAYAGGFRGQRITAPGGLEEVRGLASETQLSGGWSGDCRAERVGGMG